MKKVYFLNVFTRTGSRVQLTHPKSFSLPNTVKRSDNWEQKGYETEIVIQEAGKQSYVYRKEFAL